jgi:hypothetical protein
MIPVCSDAVPSASVTDPLAITCQEHGIELLQGERVVQAAPGGGRSIFNVLQSEKTGL